MNMSMDQVVHMIMKQKAEKMEEEAPYKY